VYEGLLEGMVGLDLYVEYERGLNVVGGEIWWFAVGWCRWF